GQDQQQCHRHEQPDQIAAGVDDIAHVGAELPLVAWQQVFVLAGEHPGAAVLRGGPPFRGRGLAIRFAAAGLLAAGAGFLRGHRRWRDGAAAAALGFAPARRRPAFAGGGDGFRRCRVGLGGGRGPRAVGGYVGTAGLTASEQLHGYQANRSADRPGSRAVAGWERSPPGPVVAALTGDGSGYDSRTNPGAVAGGAREDRKSTRL